MNLIVERKNGERIDLLEDSGIKTLDFVIDSPSPIHETETIGGMDGVIDLGTTFEPRKMHGSFYFESADLVDYALLRNEVFRLFSTKESFYLIDTREPGKRWLIKSSGYSPNQVGRYGFFKVEFGAFLPYAESIGSTLDPLTFDAQVWQFGQGLTLEETMYTQNTNTFKIYNVSDGVTIDPRFVPLLITFKGPSTNLQIKNLTTGNTWTYTGTTLANDEVKLDGIRSTKNGLTIFRDTNHKFISLAPGYNDFQIVGATGSFTISFSFRFYTI